MAKCMSKVQNAARAVVKFIFFDKFTFDFAAGGYKRSVVNNAALQQIQYAVASDNGVFDYFTDAGVQLAQRQGF